MAVRIRMTRMGSKKRPFYRLVAADSEAPRDGKFLEILGYYDPMKDPAVLKIHEDKLNYWLEKGASVSDSAKTLLKKEGMMQSHSATN
ncbi:MAG: 30S ribosomal protein S16 [Proteobacteria bacterium]|jgi:small subunit ribosomal protein S16|nr:30S ribosomal protein S16 [Desulfobacterales bacterium]MBL6967516.1 30S ribosomal protein S16 [Desulfobacteraceae bacterium]MBU0735199.1 30S ribosomal protein S16 [Pseudomonadota bacterium]MBL7101493.1 30S ribosomal protein S16 [Desulfobacteraceae bacterium]MBL7172674.1 30S ribosomal protein S16 [Desulfobacteraceae bacterium]